MINKPPTADTLNEDIEISRWVTKWIDQTARKGRASGRDMQHTIPRYQREFRRYINWLKATGAPLTPKELSGIAGGHILEDFFDYLRGNGNSNSTVALHYQTINTFFKWAAKKSDSDDPDVKLPPHVRVNPCATAEKPDDATADDVGEPFTDAEFQRMLAAAGKENTENIWKRRNRAIMLILYNAGLRRAEVAGLQIADYNASTGTLAVRQVKRTKSGKKSRQVGLFNGVKEEIDLYIDTLRDNKMRSGPLFPSTRRNADGDVVAVAPAAVNLIVSGLAHGLQDACEAHSNGTGCDDCIRWTDVHRWRHTWAINALIRKVPALSVMSAGGWANISMLQRYVEKAGQEISLQDFADSENGY